MSVDAMTTSHSLQDKTVHHNGMVLYRCNELWLSKWLNALGHGYR